MALNQQQFEKQGIYEAKSPLPSLLIDLDQIARIEESLTARRKTRAKTGGYIMLAGLIGAIVGGMINLPLLLGLSILAIPIGLGYLIYALVSGGKLVAHRARLEIAKARINMIQQDAGTQTPFSLRLILVSNPVRLSEEAWSGRRTGKQSFFEEVWFSLEGRLLDGTVLTDEIKDLTRRRTFTNPRGKHKVKTRTTYLVNVRFSYPKELYGDARPAEKALHGEVKVAPSASLRGVRVNEKAIVLKAMVGSEQEITQTVGMLSIGGYRILNLARRLAAAQRGNTK